MDACVTIEVPREGGRGRSAGSIDEWGAKHIVLAGGTPLATSQRGIGGPFDAKIDEGGSR